MKTRLLLCIVFLALPFLVSAQEPRSVLAVEVCEDKPEKQKWELYGGTGVVSAIVYNNGRVAYDAPAERFWFGGEKKRSERMTFFVEVGGYKRLTSRHVHEGGDEAELKVGIKGEFDHKVDYDLALGYRKSRGEDDTMVIEGQLGSSIKVFKDKSALKPFIRFAGELPANTAGHRKSAVVGGGISYLKVFPDNKFYVETSFSVLAGTGIEEHRTIARTDLLVVVGKWKGGNLQSSKFAIKPFVRLTGNYFSGGFGMYFGKVR